MTGVIQMSEIAMIPNEGQTEAKSPVMTALDELWNEITKLGDEVNCLESRLGNVLNPAIHDSSPSSEVPDMKKGESCSLIVSKLKMIRSETRSVRERAKLVNENLEL